MLKNKISRRQFLQLSALASAGLTIGSRLSPALAQELSGTINYIHHFTSESEFIGMESVIASFQAANPGVEIVQENIPNADFMSKFTAFVIGDARPDTTMVSSERVTDMVAMDGLVDLTDLINDWELKDVSSDLVWEGVTVDGKIYGVPAFAFIPWMYYRKDWFEEAGIDPPETLEDFTNAAIALTDPEQGRYGFGLRGGDGGHGLIMEVMSSFGVNFVEDGEIVADRDTMIEAIGWYSSLVTEHGAVPPSVTGDSYRQIMEGFKTGQTAMVWHHTGSLAEISEALDPDQFGTIARPMGPMGYPGYIGFLYNGIMKNDNLDASWAWISHWGTPEPAIEFLDATGYFPANSLLSDDERVTDNPLYGAAFDALAAGELEPQFVGASGWTRNVVLPEFQKVLIGDATVEEAVDAMLEGLEDAIE